MKLLITAVVLAALAAPSVAQEKPAPFFADKAKGTRVAKGMLSTQSQYMVAAACQYSRRDFVVQHVDARDLAQAQRNVTFFIDEATAGRSQEDTAQFVMKAKQMLGGIETMFEHPGKTEFASYISAYDTVMPRNEFDLGINPWGITDAMYISGQGLSWKQFMTDGRNEQQNKLCQLVKTKIWQVAGYTQKIKIGELEL